AFYQVGEVGESGAREAPGSADAGQERRGFLGARLVVQLRETVTSLPREDPRPYRVVVGLPERAGKYQAGAREIVDERDARLRDRERALGERERLLGLASVESQLGADEETLDDEIGRGLPVLLLERPRFVGDARGVREGAELA